MQQQLTMMTPMQQPQWLQQKFQQLDRHLPPSFIKHSRHSPSPESQVLLPALRIAIFGSVDFYHDDSPALCDVIGRKLAQQLGPNCCILTGANAITQQRLSYSFRQQCIKAKKGALSSATGAAAKVGQQKDENPHKTIDDYGSINVFHLAPVGYLCNWDFGKHIRDAGRDMEERRYLLANLADVCIVIEGGPGTVDEINKARMAGVPIIAVSRTGGAAGGLFDAPARPETLLGKPYYEPIMTNNNTAAESAWKLLSDENASIEDSAQAVVYLLSARMEPQSKEASADVFRN